MLFVEIMAVFPTYDTETVPNLQKEPKSRRGAGDLNK